MVYMITYDLVSPGQNYGDVIKAIKDCSTGVHYSCWGSSFLIKSTKTANEIFKYVSTYLDANDKFFVAEITTNCQGFIPIGDLDYVNAMFH